MRNKQQFVKILSIAKKRAAKDVKIKAQCLFIP